MENVLNDIIIFFFGAGGLALINVIQKRWEMKYERKAAKEDKAELKADKLDEFSGKLDNFLSKQSTVNEEVLTKQKEVDKILLSQSEALKLDMLEKIFELGEKYIKAGEITFDERRRLHEMHNCYHKGLGGNGDAELIMRQVDELPLKPTM